MKRSNHSHRREDESDDSMSEGESSEELLTFAENSTSFVLDKIFNDDIIGPIVDKFIDFCVDLDFDDKQRGVFSGSSCVFKFKRVFRDYKKHQPLTIFQRCLDLKFFISLSNNEKFLASSEKYKLFVFPKCVKLYITSYLMRKDLFRIKKFYKTEFKGELFNRILSDVALMFVQRQENLYNVLNDERGEYRRLYLAYKKLRTEDEVIRLQKLELKKLKQMVVDKDKIIDDLEVEVKIGINTRKNGGNRNGGSGRQRRDSGEANSIEMRRLKERNLKLENEVERLLKLNQILIKRNLRMKVREKREVQSTKKILDDVTFIANTIKNSPRRMIDNQRNRRFSNNKK